MKKQTVNVFHLAPFPYVSGGIDTWLYNLLVALSDEFSFTIYCPAPDPGQETCFDASALTSTKIVYWGNFRGYASQVRWSLSLFRRLFFRVDRDAPNLILSTVPSIFAPVLLSAAGRLRGPLLCSVRGQLAQDAIDIKKGRLFEWLVRAVEGGFLRRTDRLVANGWDTQAYLKRFYNLESDVIPNGFVQRGNAVAPGAELEWLAGERRRGKVIVSHIGTVRKIKYIDHILEGIAALTPNLRERALFLFVGKGQLEEYREKARRLGVSAQFIGERANVWPYIDASDFVVNVSGGSGVSNALIEALSRGKPVICWDNPTFSQVVRHGVSGILCRHLDAKALGDGLATAIAAPMAFDPERVREAAMPFRWENVDKRWRNLLACG
jgi:glycosyltransferase involved in cell wall biosynthesis